ncbi:unnamed protein product [Discosporangium mesarthrocarpum]
MQRKRVRKRNPTAGNVANIFTWGSNEAGQLGHGPIFASAQDVPRPVFSLGTDNNRNAVRAAAGGRHSLFLLRGGDLVACGAWDSGQLGSMDRPVVTLPGTSEEINPVPKSLIPRGSEAHPVSVRGIGKLVVSDVAAGFASSFLLTDFGEVWSWGSGRYGCLGLGDQKDRWFPERIPCFAESERRPVAQLCSGLWHVICLTESKKTFTWGRNNRGQLGLKRLSDCELNPVEMPWSPQETLLQVSAGGEHCVALVNLLRSNLKREVVAYAWGHPGNGRLGWHREPTHATPLEVEELTDMLRRIKQKPTVLSAGGSHTLALLGSGGLVAWGAGGYGQLGDGHMWDRPETVLVPGLEGVVHASAGQRHSVALVDTGAGGRQVWVWGFNRWGEGGRGGCDVCLQPQLVAGLEGCAVERVEAGWRHTIALTSGKAQRVKDLREYKGFIDAYRKGGLAVYDALKRTMASKMLNPDWLDTPLEHFPGQPGMEDKDCRKESGEPGMEWCMDTAPPGKDVFDRIRGGCEVVYACGPCRLENVCLACSRNCHSKHCIRPVFQVRDGARLCDCSTTHGVCNCKWSPMRDHFRRMAAAGPHPPGGGGGGGGGGSGGGGGGGMDLCTPLSCESCCRLFAGGQASLPQTTWKTGLRRLQREGSESAWST